MCICSEKEFPAILQLGAHRFGETVDEVSERDDFRRDSVKSFVEKAGSPVMIACTRNYAASELCPFCLAPPPRFAPWLKGIRYFHGMSCRSTRELECKEMLPNIGTILLSETFTN